MNRSLNSFKNITTGIFNKIILMAMAFLVRTLFIRYLGAEYTGLNSLFANILSVLSLAELGIGNVLMYSLYSALKENDENRIVSLITEFKKLYQKIILVILSFGLLFLFLLPTFVNTNIDMLHVYIYYILYLINSISTYFVIYRTTVISADQKNYIINICTTITTIVMYILQIISLIFFKSFLIYLIIQITCNILNNIILNKIAIKRYPFLKVLNKNDNNNNIDKKKIFKDIKATFIYKISETVLDQTDSIIISIMIGTVYVGFYSNYFLIITYLVNFVSIIANGLVASFGNLNAENDLKKSYSMFKVSMLLFGCIGIICSVCYICSVQDFIYIWIGGKYIMNYDIIIAIVFVFYLRMVTNSMWMYRTSMGLFKEVQYMSIVAAILNIVLSIVLGIYFGISGIIIATGISRLLSTFWYEGKILYRKFNVTVKEYFYSQSKCFLVLVTTLLISFNICNLINNITNNHLLLFIVKNIICVIISIFFIIIIYYKSVEFKIIIDKISNIVKNRKNKIKEV